MRQIRARIREKRGVDYTEEEIRELANVKLEKFLDPKGVRSDLLEQFRAGRARRRRAPNFAFEDTHALRDAPRPLAALHPASCCSPILKLFFNPNPLIEALHIQARAERALRKPTSEALLLRGDAQPRARADAARASR